MTIGILSDWFMTAANEFTRQPELAQERQVKESLKSKVEARCLGDLPPNTSSKLKNSLCLTSHAQTFHSLRFSFQFTSWFGTGSPTRHPRMSKPSNFRARRPPSPPLDSPPFGYPPKQLDGDYPQPTSQRFPHNREDHLDADDRLQQAKSGSLRRPNYSSFGGIKMSSLEWKALLLIIAIAFGVRLYRISYPDSVV